MSHASQFRSANRLDDVATIVLAGGKGTRLHELTQVECKPAIHFAGRNRLVDFTMANIVRSGIDRVLVATQYAPETLQAHLPARWNRHFAMGEMRLSHGRDLYSGTADAVRRNWLQTEIGSAREVLVLAADHIYDMDYAQLVAAHRAAGALVTVAADVVPRASAGSFGVMQVDAGGGIVRFHEKPADPPAIPGEPDRALVSMGIYVFDARWLRDALFTRMPEAADFGQEVIPAAVAEGQALAYRLPPGPSGAPYWRDVGTLGALRQSHMDFLSGQPARLPHVAEQRDWYLGRGSVRMPGAIVPHDARLSRTIVAADTRVPRGLVTGEDAAEDSRWFRLGSDGTILVTQAMLDRREALRAPTVVHIPAVRSAASFSVGPVPYPAHENARAFPAQIRDR